MKHAVGVSDTLITFAQQPSGPQLDSLSCVTVLEPTLSLLRTISLKWTAVCMRPACNLVDTWWALHISSYKSRLTCLSCILNILRVFSFLLSKILHTDPLTCIFKYLLKPGCGIMQHWCKVYYVNWGEFLDNSCPLLALFYWSRKTRFSVIKWKMV